MNNDDAINMVNKNHAEYKDSVERALKDSEAKLRNRVSNQKGEVIGVVTFDLNYFNNIKNKMNYIFSDRKRAQEFMKKFAIGGAITLGVLGTSLNIAGAARTNQEIQELAKSISEQEVMAAIESPSLEDDQDVLDYYLKSVPKDPMSIGPNDKAFYDQEVRTRLENLQKKIDSLKENETLGVDVAALTKEYKNEYEAIVKLMQAKNFYYNEEESMEKAKSQVL